MTRNYSIAIHQPHTNDHSNQKNEKMPYPERTAIRKDEPQGKINRSMETLEQNKTSATATSEHSSESKS